MAHDKVLQDHERAHNGQPGSKVKHGADAMGNPGRARLSGNNFVSGDWSEKPDGNKLFTNDDFSKFRKGNF